MQCPKCGADLRQLLFMNIQPDGWVCDHCHVWFADSGQPLAKVYGGDDDDQTHEILD